MYVLDGGDRGKVVKVNIIGSENSGKRTLFDFVRKLKNVNRSNSISMGEGMISVRVGDSLVWIGFEMDMDADFTLALFSLIDWKSLEYAKNLQKNYKCTGSRILVGSHGDLLSEYQINPTEIENAMIVNLMDSGQALSVWKRIIEHAERIIYDEDLNNC